MNLVDRDWSYLVDLSVPSFNTETRERDRAEKDQVDLSDQNKPENLVDLSVLSFNTEKENGMERRRIWLINPT